MLGTLFVRAFAVLTWVLALAAVSAASTAGLTFTAPSCGGHVSGNAVLSVTTPGAARVRFSIGSHTIGMGPSPGFSLTWNSNEAMDGVSAIQATALDAGGNPLASGECLVTVANRGVTLAVSSPDLTAPLSGTVAIAVTGSDTVAFPAVWTLNIDGEEQQTIWTDNSWLTPNSVTFQLDTTRFSNGAHELHISMNSRSGPQNPQWVNWRGMVNRVVHFSNLQAFEDLLPQWQSVFLPPGGTIALGCAHLYTDGSRGACAAPAYTVADSTVAAVDASGNVRAMAAGFTEVTVQDGTRSATVRVWVTASPAVPHFSGNGEMLNEYQPGKSLFVVAPFFLDPTALQSSPILTGQTRLTGVNTLSFGVYVNPRDTGADYNAWQNSFDQTTGALMDWAGNNNFHLLLTGDDIFRRIGQDAWFTLNWPSGKQAVQHAVSTMAATGVGIGIEGIDEASMIWGPRPAPQGTIGAADYLFTGLNCQGGACQVTWPANPIPNSYAFAFTGAENAALNTPENVFWTAANSQSSGFSFQAASNLTGSFSASSEPSLQFLWFAGSDCGTNAACDPPVPNDALPTIRGWMQTTPAVPLAFPCLATDPPQVDGNWMGPAGISDYASHYFTSLKVRTTYPWSEGIQEMVSSMEQEYFGRQPFVMPDRPQLMLASLAGPSYTKGAGASATYTPGVDALMEPGVSPEHVSAVMMDAAALGGAGERLYYFESPDDLASRAGEPAGASLQTGSNPINLQTAAWQAMGYASAVLTRVLDAFLLGVRLNSPAYGRNMTTAARQGSNGNMLLIVNGNDWPRTIDVNLALYQLGWGAARYLISAAGIETQRLDANQMSDRITLSAGQSVAYILPSGAAAMPLTPAHFAPAAGSYVQTGYIYPSFDQAPAVACSTGCTVDFDPRLGTFFYRFVSPGSAVPGEVGVYRTALPGSGPGAGGSGEMNEVQDVPPGRTNSRF